MGPIFFAQVVMLIMCGIAAKRAFDLESWWMPSWLVAAALLGLTSTVVTPPYDMPVGMLATVCLLVVSTTLTDTLRIKM